MPPFLEEDDDQLPDTEKLDAALAALKAPAPAALPPSGRQRSGFGPDLNDAALKRAQDQADRTSLLSTIGRAGAQFGAALSGSARVKPDTSIYDSMDARAERPVQNIMQRRGAMRQDAATQLELAKAQREGEADDGVSDRSKRARDLFKATEIGGRIAQQFGPAFDSVPANQLPGLGEILKSQEAKEARIEAARARVRGALSNGISPEVLRRLDPEAVSLFGPDFGSLVTNDNAGQVEKLLNEKRQREYQSKALETRAAQQAFGNQVKSATAQVRQAKTGAQIAASGVPGVKWDEGYLPTPQVAQQLTELRGMAHTGKQVAQEMQQLFEEGGRGLPLTTQRMQLEQKHAELSGIINQMQKMGAPTAGHIDFFLHKELPPVEDWASFNKSGYLKQLQGLQDYINRWEHNTIRAHHGTAVGGIEDTRNTTPAQFDVSNIQIPGAAPRAKPAAGSIEATPAPAAGAHPQDSAAVAWAKAHPDDPRAAAILKANGASQ